MIAIFGTDGKGEGVGLSGSDGVPHERIEDSVRFDAHNRWPLIGRAQSNLTRTLAKLEAVGFISMKTVGR